MKLSTLNLSLLIAIVILIIYIIYKECLKNVNMILIMDKYKLSGNYENFYEAAKLVDQLNTRLISFFRYLKNKYEINKVGGPLYLGIRYSKKTRKIVKLILTNYNPEAIIENDPRYSNETSYTISKGKELHVCIRNRKNPNKLHNIDDIMFVLLHEISHMGNTEWDINSHKIPFWTIFKFILHEAKESGIYNPVDYSKNPITYCGLLVNYSPYYDNSLENLWEL